MPKPIFGDNGSGMHCHQSLWKDGAPLFYDEMGYGGLSDIGRWYVGGLLKHAPSLLAFTNPTVNSYHRLVPGFEAPVNLVYSNRNRSACCRIPITGTNPKAKRIEFRVPDPSANPYLAFSAMLMAGIDGIKNKIEPPEPVDKDLYELPPDEAAAIPTVPGSLEAVLDNLEDDHAFLTEGGVFTEDLIETWIAYKREKELDAVRLRPTPHEFELYFDVLTVYHGASVGRRMRKPAGRPLSLAAGFSHGPLDRPRDSWLPSSPVSRVSCRRRRQSEESTARPARPGREPQLMNSEPSADDARFRYSAALAEQVELKWQQIWSGLADPRDAKSCWHASEPGGTRPVSKVLRHGHVPLSVRRRAACRAPARVHRVGRIRALHAHEGQDRPAPVRLRRVRAAGRAVRHRDWAASGGDNRAEHREHAASAPAPGTVP